MDTGRSENNMHYVMERFVSDDDLDGQDRRNKDDVEQKKKKWMLGLLMDAAMFMERAFTRQQAAKFIADKLHVKPKKILSRVTLSIKQAQEEGLLKERDNLYSIVEDSDSDMCNKSENEAMGCLKKKKQKSCVKERKKSRQPKNKKCSCRMKKRKRSKSCSVKRKKQTSKKMKKTCVKKKKKEKKRKTCAPRKKPKCETKKKPCEPTKKKLKKKEDCNNKGDDGKGGKGDEGGEGGEGGDPSPDQPPEITRERAEIDLV